MIYQPESDGSGALHSLGQTLSQLERDIQLASHSPSSRGSRIKDLGAYVVEKVLQILTRTLLPPPLETTLLNLKQVFTGFDEKLGPADRKLRLAEGRMILTQLQEYVQKQLENPKGAFSSGLLQHPNMRGSNHLPGQGTIQLNGLPPVSST